MEVFKMAIEGISSAVNINSTPTKQQGRTVDTAAVSAVAASGNLKVDTIKPVEEGGNTSNTWDKDKRDDKNQLQSDKEVAPEKVKSAIDDLNKQIKQNARHTNLSFKYHDETNRISITVKDSDTDEVIKEIPAEKALDMLAKAWEMAGLLIDEKR